MLTSAQFDALLDPMTSLYEDFTQSILNDIARRLSGMDMTSTAAWQLQRLVESGAVYDKALDEIARLTGKSSEALNQAFARAGVKSLEFDDSIYRAAGLNPPPLKLSPAMQQYMLAGLDKTKGAVNNLTMTTAQTSRDLFIKTADRAYLQVSTGTKDYDSAIRDAIQEAADNGVSVIGFKGREDQLDVAMRRSVLSGVTQTTAKLQDSRADEMGVDLVQVSAHIGSRPSHQAWQGRVFSRSGTSDQYPSLVSETKYGTVGGLCGANCRHTYYPYFKGISQSAYKQATLDEFSAKSVKYNGDTLTAYEATQVQRSMEREVRRHKRAAGMLASAGQPADEPLSQVHQWQARLRDFTKQTGLGREYQREGGAVRSVNPLANKPPVPTVNPVGAIRVGSSDLVRLYRKYERPIKTATTVYNTYKWLQKTGLLRTFSEIGLDMLRGVGANTPASDLAREAVGKVVDSTPVKLDDFRDVFKAESLNVRDQSQVADGIEYLEEVFKPYKEAFTGSGGFDPEALAKAKLIRGYTSDQYIYANKFLRGQSLDTSFGPFLGMDKVNKTVAALDEAFSEVPAIKGQLTVVRGGANLKDLVVGSTIEDQAYVSTSLNLKIAMERLDGGAIYVIRIPDGSSVLPIDGFSFEPREAEIILNRGSRFIVDKIDEVPDGKVRPGVIQVYYLTLLK